MVETMANAKWSEDLTIQMIIEYEKREYLWNPMSELYKNKKIREQGYQEIINDLRLHDVTIKELKNKIKNIRSSYSVELKKIRAARKDIGNSYKPSVTWFEHADRFLRAIVTPCAVENTLLDIDEDSVLDFSEKKSAKKRRNSARRRSSSSSAPFVLNTPSPRPSTPYSLQTNGSPFLNVSSSAPFLTPPVGVATPLTPLTSIYTPKKKKIDEQSIFGRSESSDLPQFDGAEDEFEMFAKLIANQLRKLPLSLALDTQLKIQTLVNAARIQAVYQQYSYAGPSREAISVNALSNNILSNIISQSSKGTLDLRQNFNVKPEQMDSEIDE